MTKPTRRHTDWSEATLRILPPGQQPVAEEETAEQHIRNAVQLLVLADERVQVLTIPADAMLTELIRGAEARCFRALFEMGQKGGAR